MTMKKINFLSLILTVFLFAGFCTSVKAQDNSGAPDQPAAAPRPNLMAQLGLTQDQIRQVRQVNQEKKPQMRAAQELLREANRNLDQAVYADVVNDAEIQTRLKEVQAAHAEVIKIRSVTELAVRKVLTPDQLAKFREVRQQFMENKELRQDNVKTRSLNAPNRQNQINRRLNNRLTRPHSGN